MKIQWNVNFRRFNKDDDDKHDSGYYDGLDSQRATIDVNIEDDSFEQVKTIYHEVTHAIFDLICQYEFDSQKKQVKKRDSSLKKEWKKFDTQKNREEEICRLVEDAAEKVMKRKLPRDFQKKFFPDKPTKRKQKSS